MRFAQEPTTKRPRSNPGLVRCITSLMKVLYQPAELQTAAAYQSTYIENALRHRMTAELCSELWKRNCHAALHIFNSEVDNAGFDMVLRLQSAVRYVQIKQAHAGKVPPHCSTRVSFSQMAGSCIVLISYDLEDLTINAYRFFGKKPHEPMQNIKALSRPYRLDVETRRASVTYALTIEMFA